MRIEDDRLQNLVRVAQRGFGAFVSQTARTVDLLGGKILRAVQCEQIIAIQKAKGAKLVAALQPL
jgi:alkyl hydroperoxide reductase subunit AhpF